MSVEAAIVVFSDFHFGRDLFEAPETTQFRMSQLLRLASKIPGVDRYIETGCRGHSIDCVTKLPFYLNYVLNELKLQGYYSAKETFDLFLLLGDQVTIPDAQSYKFIREYLTQKTYETITNGYVTISCQGLNIHPSRLVAIPGNHDKLLRQNLDFYHAEFASRLGLPQINPQSCVLIRRVLGNCEILFVLVEASCFTNANQIDISCREHLARGVFSEALEKTIRMKLDLLRKGETVDGIKLGRSYNEITKIMLVHYAVDYQACRVDAPLSHRFVEQVLPHQCERIGDVVELLGRDYQLSLVFHGHLHSPRIYDYRGVQVLSATTTTQDNSRNGFFLLKVMDTGELRAEHHIWNGRAFAADPETSLNQKLGHLAAAA